MADGSIVFDHVHVVSVDPESAASWYVDNLGGEITARFESLGAPQIFVGFPGATIMVRGRRPGDEPGKKPGLQWGMDHFGFRVQGDFRGFCDGLKGKGVKFTMEPVDVRPDTSDAFVEAPDGVSIEFYQKRD